jgi:hypothetical protein
MTADRPQPYIDQLVSTAKRLRSARKACRQFLALWTMQQSAIFAQQDGDESELSDPMNHDWTILYRGSVLDD